MAAIVGDEVADQAERVLASNGQPLRQLKLRIERLGEKTVLY